MTREIGFAPGSIRADASERVIAGYASRFHTMDSYRDVVLPGAFTRTLAEHRDRVRVLYQHNTRQPIGPTPFVLEEDDEGLRFEAKLTRTQLADEVLEMAADGTLTGVSIGFLYASGGLERVSEGSEHDDGKHPTPYWRVTGIELYELSPVTWGAMPGALIDEVRARHRAASSLEDLVRLRYAPDTPDETRAACDLVLSALTAGEAPDDHAAALAARGLEVASPAPATSDHIAQAEQVLERSSSTLDDLLTRLDPDQPQSDCGVDALLARLGA